MKLFTFGDSYTEGVGCDLAKENKILDSSQKTLFRNKHSWPAYLSNLLQIPHINYGVGGSSNKMIFDMISNCLKEKIILQGDFVIIMWSSSLRDDTPFFPKEEWNIWGNRFKEKTHIFQNILNTKHSNNSVYNNALASYKLFFIENIFSENYYDIVNQNYILYLQYMLEQMGVTYVFCDAFDLMVRKNLLKDIDKTHLIKKKNYWQFQNISIRDLLISTNRNDIWEDNEVWLETTAGKHPNKVGYELIAKELYEFILDNNILNNQIKIKNNII